MTDSYLTLPEIFQDNMVIPRAKSWVLQGKSSELNQVVSVSIDHVKVAEDKTNPAGNFSLIIPAITSSSETISISIEIAALRRTIRSVHIGHVFLMAGQSNMEFPLKDCASFQKEVDDPHHIRGFYYNVPQIEYVHKDGTVIPADLPKPCWLPLDSKQHASMSAVAFYAAVAYQEEHPHEWIGIIDCYKGGTSASAWIERSQLSKSQLFVAAYIEPFQSAIRGKNQAIFDQETKTYRESVAQHNKQLADYLHDHPHVSLSDAKNVVGHTPWPFPARPESYLRPGGLWETMVSKITDFPVNGVIWYQGENDTDHAAIYSELLSLLIQSWRQQLHDRSLPFYIIQLPGYADGRSGSWAVLRQQQLKVTQSLPQVHLISIADTGEAHNIHPTDKRPVGKRIGRILAETSYTHTPIMSVVHWDHQHLRLKITAAYAVSQTMRLVIDVQAPNGIWHVISPVIDNCTIEITGDYQALRYGDTDLPQLVLFNEFNDPVSPIRLKRGNEK